MRNRRILLCALAIVSIYAALFTVETFSQKRRSRARRVTRPTQPAPDTSGATNDGEPSLVSSAESGGRDANATNNAQRTRRSATDSASDSDTQRLQKTVERLSSQVDRLSSQLKDMRDEQGVLVSMDRLSNAEQRAENLRSQLRDVQDKEANMQARIEQIDYELQPDNLDRRVAGIGTLQPDKVRENVRSQLERERARLSSQLASLVTSRQRLEASVADADAQVDRLREHLNDVNNAQNVTRANNTNATNNANTNNSTTPNNSESVPSTNNNQSTNQSPPTPRENTNTPPQ